MSASSMKTTRLRLLECPCGHKVRVSRSVMGRVSLSCDRGHILEPADPADRKWLYDRIADQRGLEPTPPKGLRIPTGTLSGWTRGTPRCWSCRAFLRGPGCRCTACGQEQW